MSRLFALLFLHSPEIFETVCMYISQIEYSLHVSMYHCGSSGFGIRSTRNGDIHHKQCLHKTSLLTVVVITVVY